MFAPKEACPLHEIKSLGAKLIQTGSEQRISHPALDMGYTLIKSESMDSSLHD